jgi:hypothetical protein
VGEIKVPVHHWSSPLTTPMGSHQSKTSAPTLAYALPVGSPFTMKLGWSVGPESRKP